MALGLVYRIPCSECSWSYIGETGRSLQERISEHKRAVANCQSNSEVASHVWERDHEIDWEGVSVLARESGKFRRWFKEAWFTRAQRSGNRTFHELDKAWFELI